MSFSEPLKLVGGGGGVESDFSVCPRQDGLSLRG